MNNQYPVYTLTNECHDCYKCIRECPVKAIKIANGHASVIPERCIACGNCVKACPSNAKRVRNDIDKVKNLIKAKKEVYVSLAPSWRASFENSAEKMIALLKQLGFKDVSETALGAQEVSIKTAQILNNADKGLFISSACPVMVDFIKHYLPEFTQYIIPIGSPLMTHAKMLKEIYGNDIAVVFVGPCIAKKNEVTYSEGLFDFALTFDELRLWINDEKINISEIIKDNHFQFVPESAYEGTLYPIDGGMNQTIRKSGINNNVQLLEICGVNSLKRALENLAVEKLDKTVFIEALACDGGCVNGPCISSNKAGVNMVSDILSKEKKRDKIPAEPKVVVEYTIEPRKVVKSDYPLEEILKTLKKIGKHSVDDELNCGGCGYATCRDLAKALLDGDAETSMCVSYMRKIAVRKAAAMIRCMPAAVVMVDSNLNILEANDSFMKMFAGDMYDVFKSHPNGMAGTAIDKIVDFTDIFKTILKTGKDLHKEHYHSGNRLLDISAFTIEENEIVGAVISDVTKAETNREKIAQKAHEVISKNISIVQEIACLLGEHMVETETLLSSIADDYDKESE